jgi:Zn-finger nucleic acid-binding protein
MWIPTEVFDRMMKTQERRGRSNATAFRQGSPDRARLPSAPVTYVRCPTCGKPMNRSHYGRASGVVVDECRADGVWLDAHELEKIARYVTTGGLRQARQLEQTESARVEPDGPGSLGLRASEPPGDAAPLSRLLAAIVRAVVP